MIASLGKANGAHLLNLSRGIDDRPVEVNRELKSVGHEETFAHDLHDPADLDRELVRLCDAVASRLRERRTGARTLTLKVRFAGFETITRSTTGAEPVDTGPSIVAALRPLLDRIDPTGGVRLLGVSTSNFGEPVQQLSLLDADDAASDRRSSTRRAAGTVDEIRDRFGALAIGPASSVGRSGLRLVRPGAQQWGPDHDVHGVIHGDDSPDDGSCRAGLRRRVEREGRTCDDGAQPRVGMTYATLRGRTADPPPDRAGTRTGPHVLEPRLQGLTATPGVAARSASSPGWP